MAEPFLYPVDGSLYPEYYQVVAEPMDLETARGKLNEYGSLYEALTDLRRIWSNCRLFNQEGSDIWGWTYEMAEALEELVEVRDAGDACLLLYCV